MSNAYAESVRPRHRADQPRLNGEQKANEEPTPVHRGSRAIDVRLYTPAELAGWVSVQPEWVVQGYAARQAITELGGKIKRAGKTTWIMHAIRAVLDGVPFMGYATTRDWVIYVTEQQPGPFLAALQRAGLDQRGEELMIVFRRDMAHLPWPAVVSYLADYAQDLGDGVLVVDTLGKLAGVADENSAGDAARAMAPLQNAAHDGLCVIVARHERKSGGEVGDSGRGSSAFGGDADVILSLRRPEGQARSTLREVHALSRYTETPEALAIDLTADGYVALGSPDAVAMAEAVRFVSSQLRERFDRNEPGATADELIAAAADAEHPMSDATVRRGIRRLEEQQLVSKSGRGVKGDPRRFAWKGERDA